jgi:molecular chaperone DnaJ
MSRKRDCYQVLGVAPDASPEDIRKAFRREAAKNHPDRHPNDPVAESKFKEINEAYQVLSDDAKRSIYDQFGWEGVEPYAGDGDGHGFTGVQDVFNTMQEVFAEAFSGAFGSKIPPGVRQGPARRAHVGARRGQDLRIEHTLTLRESIFGCAKVVPVRSAVMCSECEGSGARRGTQPEVCRGCSGSGQRAQARGFVMFSQPCPQCGSSGRIVASPCGACRGQGGIETERQVEVHFAPGLNHGSIVRVHGYGLPGSGGGVPGDLLVSVAVKPDERFTRTADDLMVEVHILFTDAILGADIKVPVLDPSKEDVTITVQIPPGTQHGAMIRLPGHGVHRWHHGGRGSLVAIIHVDLPPTLSERARALVAELNAELLQAMPGKSAPAAPSGGSPPAALVLSPEDEQDAKVRALNSIPIQRDELS